MKRAVVSLILCATWLGLPVAVTSGRARISVERKPEAEQNAAKAMFARIRSLVGEWEGTVEWSGARTSSGSVAARYYLTAGGSAVVEDLLMGGENPSMTSVYHLSGADLWMTHFCAAQNQPRFKASRVDSASGEAYFAFVDITYSGPVTSGYVHTASLRIEDPGHVHIRFVFDQGEKQAIEDLSLRRVKGSSS